MKQKGFTLMEIVVAMSVAFLMLGAVGSLLLSYVKSYKNSVVQGNGFNYLNDSIAIIEREVNNNSREVKTDENVIKIYYSDAITINYIEFKNGKLYTLYGNKYKLPMKGSYNNTIIDGVKDFVAIKSGKILYIKVVWNNGQSIERCLAIENAN